MRERGERERGPELLGRDTPAAARRAHVHILTIERLDSTEGLKAVEEIDLPAFAVSAVRCLALLDMRLLR
jgi:hypothetical protein